MVAIPALSNLAPVGTECLGKLGKPNVGGRSFNEVLSRSAVPAASTGQTTVAGAGSWLSRIESGRQRLDRIIAQSQAGRSFSPRELLVLQAEVYRVTEELSLAQRVVEEGVGGIKRLWNMQI